MLLGAILAVVGVLAVGGSKAWRENVSFAILLLGGVGAVLAIFGIVMIAKNHL